MLSLCQGWQSQPLSRENAPSRPMNDWLNHVLNYVFEWWVPLSLAYHVDSTVHLCGCVCLQLVPRWRQIRTPVFIHIFCKLNSPIADIMKDDLNLPNTTRWSSGFPTVCPRRVARTRRAHSLSFLPFRSSLARLARSLLRCCLSASSLQGQSPHLATSAACHADVLRQLSQSVSCFSLESVNREHFSN